MSSLQGHIVYKLLPVLRFVLVATLMYELLTEVEPPVVSVTKNYEYDISKQII